MGSGWCGKGGLWNMLVIDGVFLVVGFRGSGEYKVFGMEVFVCSF